MSKNNTCLNSVMRRIAKKKFEANIISEAQYCRTVAIIKKIEKEKFSLREVKNINVEDIQNYLNSLINYSDSEIKKIYEQFNQAYKYLYDIEVVSKNIMLQIYKPKSIKKTKEVKALTLEEEKLLIDKLIKSDNEMYSLIYLIQLFTGMRIGEVLALKISDINFKNNQINVNKTLTRDVNYKVIIKESTKTRTSERIIPIPRMIRKKLKERVNITIANKKEALFLTKKGNYIDSRDASKFLKKQLDKFMDSTDISSHNLRHTYITRCAESGMNPSVLKKLVGHKDIETTLGTYTTVYDNFTKSEMNKIKNYYKRNKLQIGEISRFKSDNWLRNTKSKEIKNRIKIFIYQIRNDIKYLFTSK